MSINIGEVAHPEVGQIKVEISNDDEFVRRVKEISKKIPGTNKEKMRYWKIRVVGQERVPAKVQALIDGAEDTTPTMREFVAQQNGDARPVRRARPGGKATA